MYNDTESYNFETASDCAQWLIDNQKTTSKSLRNVR